MRESGNFASVAVNLEDDVKGHARCLHNAPYGESICWSDRCWRCGARGVHDKNQCKEIMTKEQASVEISLIKHYVRCTRDAKDEEDFNAMMHFNCFHPEVCMLKCCGGTAPWLGCGGAHDISKCPIEKDGRSPSARYKSKSRFILRTRERKAIMQCALLERVRARGVRGIAGAPAAVARVIKAAAKLTPKKHAGPHCTRDCVHPVFCWARRCGGSDPRVGCGGVHASYRCPFRGTSTEHRLMKASRIRRSQALARKRADERR